MLRNWQTSEKIALAALIVSLVALAFSTPGQMLYRAVWGPEASIIDMRVQGGLHKGQCDALVGATVSARNIDGSGRLWLATMTYNGEWYPVGPVNFSTESGAAGWVTVRNGAPYEIALVLVQPTSQGVFGGDMNGLGASSLPPGSRVLSSRAVNWQGCDRGIPFG